LVVANSHLRRFIWAPCFPARILVVALTAQGMEIGRRSVRLRYEHDISISNPRHSEDPRIAKVVGRAMSPFSNWIWVRADTPHLYVQRHACWGGTVRRSRNLRGLLSSGLDASPLTVGSAIRNGDLAGFYASRLGLKAPQADVAGARPVRSSSMAFWTVHSALQRPGQNEGRGGAQRVDIHARGCPRVGAYLGHPKTSSATEAVYLEKATSRKCWDWARRRFGGSTGWQRCTARPMKPNCTRGELFCRSVGLLSSSN